LRLVSSSALPSVAWPPAPPSAAPALHLLLWQASLPRRWPGASPLAPPSAAVQESDLQRESAHRRIDVSKGGRPCEFDPPPEETPVLLMRASQYARGEDSLLCGHVLRRERVLFIGTQFSILYTSMYSPAEAATRTHRECEHIHKSLDIHTPRSH